MSETVTDAKGRVLEVRRPSGMEGLRLTRACGKSADIDRWFGPIMLAACVRTIDGVPCPLPASVDQAEALADKVGPHGLDAVGKWASENPPEEFDKDAAKN